MNEELAQKLQDEEISEFQRINFEQRRFVFFHSKSLPILARESEMECIVFDLAKGMTMKIRMKCKWISQRRMIIYLHNKYILQIRSQ
jgi:hypothetical protein